MKGLIRRTNQHAREYRQTEGTGLELVIHHILGQQDGGLSRNMCVHSSQLHVDFKLVQCDSDSASLVFAAVTMAIKYVISQCTVADSSALTRNNIPAFWADPYWVLAWKHRTLEHHISQVAKRMPRNLLNDRHIKRHQKAVEPATGRLVGYARWILPESHAVGVDGGPAWPEAVVPAVDAAEEAEMQRVADTAIWDPNEESDGLVKPVQEAKREILARKEYIGTLRLHSREPLRSVLTVAQVSTTSLFTLITRARGSGLR